MRALKRKEIIKIWKKQQREFLNVFCCPDCRDVLSFISGKFICINQYCLNRDAFDKDGKWIDEQHTGEIS